VWHKRKDGTVFPTLMNATVIKDEKGRPLFLSATAIDITEHKKAEERYRDIVELAPDGIVTLDKKGVITSCNNVTSKITGYSKDEIVGKHFSKLGFLRIKDIPKYPKIFNSILRGKPIKPFEVTWRKKDGTPRLSEIHVSVMKEDGKTIGLQVFVRDITERKRAEEALRESEERYRAIFERAADSIVLVDAETGALVEFNDKAHENLGYTREEFEKLKIPDFEVIESTEEVTKHIEKIIKEGADTFGTKHRTKGGEIRDIQVSSKAIPIRGRNFVQSIWRDITERKRAEEALREGEERYRQLVELSPDAIAVHSEGKVVFINTAGAKLLGAANPEQLIGKPILDFVHPDYREVVKERVREVRERDTKVPLVEEKFIRLDGTDVDVEVTAIHFTYQGKPAVQAVARDITERKQAEGELKKLSSAVDAMVDGVTIITSLHGKITYVNRAVTKQLGYKKEELIGKLPTEFIAKKDKPKFAAEAKKMLFGKSIPKSSKYLAKHKDGTEIPMSVNFSILHDHEGEPREIIAVSKILPSERRRSRR